MILQAEKQAYSHVLVLGYKFKESLNLFFFSSSMFLYANTEFNVMIWLKKYGLQMLEVR